MVYTMVFDCLANLFVRLVKNISSWQIFILWHMKGMSGMSESSSMAKSLKYQDLPLSEKSPII